MFANIPELNQISGLSNFKYSGNAGSMFQSVRKSNNLDLKYFDTSQINNMSFMFYEIAANSLDISNFDTSKVNTMYGMFDNAKNLENIDVSNFNTSNVKNMKFMFLNNQTLKNIDLRNFTISKDSETEGMFSNDISLQQLTLGNKSNLKSDMNIPDIDMDGIYSGKWQNIGERTDIDRKGANIWTSKELMNLYNPSGTYVWQKDTRIYGQELTLGSMVDYSKDVLFKNYVPSAAIPIHSYRYNVIPNNDYPFYTSI